jgi:tetratricopeptide (TPR) repeat protein
MRTLSESINLERGKAWYELNLGNIYYYQNDLNKAMQLYNIAKNNAEEIQDSIIITDALTGISDIQMRWGDYKTSLQNLYVALDYALSIKKLRMQFLLYDDIANIYKLTNKYDSSYVYYLKTLNIAEQQENTFGILVSNVNLLYVKYKLNPIIDVIPDLEKLQMETKEHNFMRLNFEIGFTICEIMQDKGRYKEAYDLYQKTFAIRDSIIGQQGIRQVAELESNYLLKKKELENMELMRQNEVKSFKLRNRIIVMFLSIFILIQAIILIVIIFRKYKTIKQNLATIRVQERKIFEKEKELLNKEKEAIELKLEYKDREHTSKAMKIFHHNQLIQKVIGELINIREVVSANSNYESAGKLHAMVNELKHNLNDHMWKEFETIFIESNPGYLKKLAISYPNLTPNEIKLCVLLHLNMRTKDITTITQQSIKSINVARTRLRKKLNLENTSTNLSTFLQQIN